MFQSNKQLSTWIHEVNKLYHFSQDKCVWCVNSCDCHPIASEHRTATFFQWCIFICVCRFICMRDFSYSRELHSCVYVLGNLKSTKRIPYEYTTLSNCNVSLFIDKGVPYQILKIYIFRIAKQNNLINWTLNAKFHDIIWCFQVELLHFTLML